ncbi:MAG: hypothetical protein E6R03_08995 [Hyphomicrobiaceae bacterium]|nr:MAG: hypothetical protein E6R03_08995 [Hyphomicrobiaceae bacterium]
MTTIQDGLTTELVKLVEKDRKFWAAQDRLAKLVGALPKDETPSSEEADAEEFFLSGRDE